MSGRRRTSWLYAVASVAVGLGLLALVAYLAGAQATLATLRRLRAWQIGALVASAFVVSLWASLSWGVILRCYRHGVSVWLLFELSLLVFAVGWMVPSGFVAGIPVAAYILRRRGVPLDQGLASFTISRFFETTAYAIVLPAGVLSQAHFGLLVRRGALMPIAAVAVTYLDLFLGWRLGRRTLGVLGRVAPRFLPRPLAGAHEFCREVADFFAAPLPSILAAAGLSFLAIGTSFVRTLLTAWFLGIEVSVPEVAVLFAITLFLVAVPFLPGAVGVYEGGIVGAFELLGRPRAMGLAYAIAVHGVEMVVVIVGLLFLVREGLGVLEAPRRIGGN